MSPTQPTDCFATDFPGRAFHRLAFSLDQKMGDARQVQFLLLVLLLATSLLLPFSSAIAEENISRHHEFSGSLLKQVNGKKYHAQVFAKGDRLRLEYKYAIRTDYGYAAIEIIRLDQSEAWYLLAQQKELLVTPLDPDDVLPMRASLPGERGRTLIGDATAAGRAAQLYEVQTDRHGRTERFYEWVDREADIVLKLISQDRDWSFEYERIRWSPQPDYYFDEPPGYKKRIGATAPKHQG